MRAFWRLLPLEDLQQPTPTRVVSILKSNSKFLEANAIFHIFFAYSWLQEVLRLGDGLLAWLWGMSMESLDMGACHGLNRVGLQHLRDMLVTVLELGWCRKLVTLGGLRNLQLSSLALRSCGSLRDLGGLGASPLTCLDLSNCWEFRNGDLAPLQGSLI